MTDLSSSSSSPSPLQGRPANVDEADWKQLQSAFASVTSPGFGISPASLSDPTAAAELGNDPALERNWATTAGRHAETYYRLLTSLPDHSKLRLTAIDQTLYSHFRAIFPSLDVGRLSESESLKGRDVLERWRQYCQSYVGNDKLKDYNFGCLLRLDASGSYDDRDNVVIVPKVQWLAIEIARNREGKNRAVRRQRQ